MTGAPARSSPALRVVAAGVDAALPIAVVVEVCRALPVEPVQDAPRGVVGLVRWRGRGVPLVDLGWLLAGASSAPDRLVVVRVDDRFVAVGVGEIRGIGPIGDLADLPPLLDAGDAGVVEALAERDGAVVRVLDAARLLPAPLSGTDA